MTDQKRLTGHQGDLRDHAIGFAAIEQDSQDFGMLASVLGRGGGGNCTSLHPLQLNISELNNGP